MLSLSITTMSMKTMDVVVPLQSNVIVARVQRATSNRTTLNSDASCRLARY